MALTALAVLLGATLPSHGHVVSVADQLRGITMTETQCVALPQTVWVGVMSRNFCIRYYLSTAGGPGTRPAVFLQGDRLGRLNLKTGEFSPGPRDKDIDTDDLARMAEGLSKQTASSAIYLARPGLDGSSGDHRIRHSTLEQSVINAALDAIKRRHGFEGFHLIGQSGGSTLVGGVLALRTDVGCAVIGSGRLLYDKAPPASSDPGRQYFNVADAVPIIAQRRATRILLVTDPLDRKVPEQAQAAFVRMLRQAGGQAEQFLVQAVDDDRHGVTAYSRTAAAACMRGASSEDIAQRLEQQVEKRLAAKAAMSQQQAAATTATTTGASSNATASAMTAQSAAGR
jgi:pimeloyl-ACP methyl ester carboxylesterase